MDPLAKKTADIALRLAAVPDGATPEKAELDELEQIVRDVLRQISAARLHDGGYQTGEIRGMWPVYNPRHQ